MRADRRSEADALDRPPGSVYLTIVLNMRSRASRPDHLSTILAALADPTRRTILARLSAGEATVTALAEPLPISLPAVSRHLKVLEHAGLITRGHDAQWRPCRLEATPLREVADWVEQYRRFWDQSLQRLDDYLRTLHTKRKRGKTDARRKP